MFIKISWYCTYERTTLEALVADERAAFAVCSALDNDEVVRQWTTDQELEFARWYKYNNGFKKLKHNFKDWEYH